MDNWDGFGLPTSGQLVKFTGNMVIFFGVDPENGNWVFKHVDGRFLSQPKKYFSKAKTPEEQADEKFLLDLADVLEKHKVCLVSHVIESKHNDGVYSKVAFQRKGADDMFPILERCHLSPYDLRTESGMSSLEANNLFEHNKAREHNE